MRALRRHNNRDSETSHSGTIAIPKRLMARFEEAEREREHLRDFDRVCAEGEPVAQGETAAAAEAFGNCINGKDI